MKRKLAVLMALVLSISLFATGCGSKSTDSKETAKIDYPTKPIELIVPFAAGGGTDAVGRALAESLKGILKQEVVVVNKTGGGGAVGMAEGLNADPDGYKLTLFTREVVSLPLQGQAPFKTMDFKFVANVNIDPTVIVVPAKSKYKTIKELFDDIKANPNKLNFAAAAVPNFYGLHITQALGLQFVTVPFNGAAAAIPELLGGRADFGIYSPSEVKAHVESGNLRALAVMSEDRFAGLKDVPSLKESGYDIVSGTYRGVAVNPKTPDEIVKKLESAIEQATKDPKFIEFMSKSFVGIGYKNSADITSYIEKDIKVLEPIISSTKK